MKYLHFFIMLIFISSCCSTKSLPQESPKTNVKIDNPKVVILKENNDVNDSIQVSNEEIIEEPIIEHDTTLFYPEAFNHNTWNDLLKNYVSKNGNVNYKAFQNNREALLKYIKELGQNMPNKDWTQSDKLAYWINAYNAMTIDLILRHYPIKSIKDIKSPWKQRYWKLGEKWYNLDEIEHHILRKMEEPRIHFAIVCASISCPNLLNEAFTSTKMGEQMNTVTRNFLNDPTKNNLSDEPIKLSKIFKWFAKDFNQNSTLTKFLNKYSEETVYSSTKKIFMDYNWDLNE